MRELGARRATYYGFVDATSREQPFLAHRPRMRSWPETRNRARLGCERNLATQNNLICIRFGGKPDTRVCLRFHVRRSSIHRLRMARNDSSRALDLQSMTDNEVITRETLQVAALIGDLLCRSRCDIAEQLLLR